ncbi:Isoleucyl-tRNA synthetase, class Ia [Beggiatoa sp. PS]|nr:Isoleucyl-tRNA synthetase, class Ia [Beggiatoa sp. PS]
MEMGSFYLDIIKDRQYTCQTNSVARRSTQTALYHIVEALVRWLAPILSFTAEDIWQFMPGKRSESVLLATWYEGLFPYADEEVKKWAQIIAMREVVYKALEELRTSETIGSSLDAEVDIYCDDALYTQLNALEDELRFVLITSYARIHPSSAKPEEAVAGEGFWVTAVPSTHQKCVRCWHHREEVGTHTEHPQLCGRCIENVTGDGEQRRYA